MSEINQLPESNEKKSNENEYYEDDGCLNGATFLFFLFMALILIGVFIIVEKAN